MTPEPQVVFYTGLGNRIRQARHDRGLTQREVADQLGVSNAAVAYWERARCRPSVYMVHRLERALRTVLA